MFRLLSEKFTPDLAFDVLSHELRVTPTDRIALKMILEYVFEAMRKRIDPRLPSRLSSIFLFLERECADIFQQRFAEQRQQVSYKCVVQGWWFQAQGNTVYEATRPLAPRDLSRSSFHEALERVSACAASYWSNGFDDPSWPELFVDSNVELVAIEHDGL